MAKIDKEINEALIEDILQIYADAEDKMLKAVAKRVAKGITTEGWNEIKLKDTQALKQEIEKLLSNTTKLSKSKVSKGILDAYKSGVQEVGGAKGTHKTVLDELDVPMNLKMLVLSTNNLLDNASFQVLRKANDAYQQVMANATTGLLAGTDTRMQTSQKMLNEFASKGITTFVDKAGRNWDLGSYAEMCARTVSSHAALQGHIDRQLEVGEDLVKVSTIGTTCPICQRWQGVVLSISGNHPKYHSLDQAKATGLFHPNCKHTLGMFIPELDGEGKVEPDPINMNTESSKRNKLIEQQRANERNIRYWKKRKALALTLEEEKKCNEKIKAWQYKNLIHCEKNGLRRQYAREGVRTGNAQGPMGTFIGGNLKEYEEVFKNVVGEEPKKTFGMLKMNLQFFAEKGYETWLKDEITSLDDLDVEKAMMKDPNNKTVTPTSLYKKYIGDNPIKDFEEITLYVKGTKEFKSSYAKWLKEEIEEIGVSYKIKPKYTEVHEDIPEEDKKLSATEIYKKYHDGEKPGDAYKKLGGEEGTGMKYGKWVEMQKKELIKNGITKTAPFSNSTVEKTSQVISQASKGIDDAKKFVEEKAKMGTIPEKDLELTAIEFYAKYHKKSVAIKDYNAYGKSSGLTFTEWVKAENQKVIDELGIKEAKKKAVVKIEKVKEPAKKPKLSTKKQADTEAKIEDLYKKFVDSSSSDKLKIYKSQLDSSVTGVYTASQQVKKAWNEYDMAKGDAMMFGGAKKGMTASDILQDNAYKYEIAKLKHLEMIDKSIKEGKVLKSEIEDKVAELDKLLGQVKGDTPYVKHLKDQKALYKGSKSIHKIVKEKYDEFFPGEYESDMEFIEQEKLRLIQEAEAKKQQSGSKFSNDEVVNMCKNMSTSFEENKWKAKFNEALKEMGHTGNFKTGKFGTCYFDIHDYISSEKQKAIDEMTTWQAIGDYTSGSRPHNFAFKTNKSAEEYFQTRSRYTREQAQQIAKKLDKAFEVDSAVFEKDVVLRHGNDEAGLIGLLGSDDDFESYTHSKFVDRLKVLNEVAETQGTVVLNETGFLSTSPSANGGFTQKPVEVRIVCPKGSKGLYVEDYSYYSGEEEIILQRGRNYRFVKAYSRDLDKSEFKKVQNEMTGSGKGYATDTIIFLELLD